MKRWKGKTDAEKLVDKFRLWAFHQYYDHAYRHVEDLTIRFVYAIAASSRPIPPQALPKWRAQMVVIKADQKRMKALGITCPIRTVAEVEEDCMDEHDVDP